MPRVSHGGGDAAHRPRDTSARRRRGRALGAGSDRGEHALDVLGDHRLGPRADDGLHQLAARVEVQRRDRHDAVVARDLRVLVGVDLDDLDAARVLRRELLEHGGDHAARAAPGRPEVDDDGDLRLEDLGLEGGVGDGGGGAHRISSA